MKKPIPDKLWPLTRAIYRRECKRLLDQHRTDSFKSADEAFGVITQAMGKAAAFADSEVRRRLGDANI